MGAELERQARDAAEDDAWMHRQRRVVDAHEIASAIEKRREGHLRLEAREVGAEAVVRPEAEREVAIVAARDVEALGVGEDRLVAIRRAEPADDELVRLDAMVVQLDGANRAPWVHLHRRRPAQYLV